MVFDEFCRKNGCTYFEKDALAWQLAMLRAHAIYRQLRPQPRWRADRNVSRAVKKDDRP